MAFRKHAVLCYPLDSRDLSVIEQLYDHPRSTTITIYPIPEYEKVVIFLIYTDHNLPNSVVTLPTRDDAYEIAEEHVMEWDYEWFKSGPAEAPDWFKPGMDYDKFKKLWYAEAPDWFKPGMDYDKFKELWCENT